MQNYLPSQIWEDADQQLNWYNCVTGKQISSPSKKCTKHCNNNGSDYNHFQSQISSDSAWFYQMKALDAMSQDDVHVQPLQYKTQNNYQGSDRLAEPKQDPYFEYMFADAGLDASSPETCDDLDESVDKLWQCHETNQDVLTPPDFEPATPEFAEPHLAIKIVKEQRASQVDRAELDHHIIDFQEVPSCVSYDWIVPSHQTSDVAIKPLDHFHHSDTSSPQQSPLTCDPEYPLIDFKTTYSSQELLESSNFNNSILQASFPAYGTENQSGINSHLLELLELDEQIKKNSNFTYQASTESKKRPAGKDFDDNSTDDSEVYLASSTAKKPRVKSGASSETCEFQLLHPSEDEALKSPSSSRTDSQDFFKHKPLPSPPKGFTGQFDGMLIDKDMRAVFPFQPHEPPSRFTFVYTFGNRAHPNGTFTHTHFHEDSLAANTEFDQRTLPPTHPLKTCMEFANDMTDSSCHPNIVALRSHDEEILRREAHLECTSARLEGVAVGFYRYLQGSYELEEYRRAGMCICWDVCSCNKMCTRYGDLKCPCSKDIIVHGDN